jgi:hypothetical protein
VKNVWGVTVKPKTYEDELELAEQLLVAYRLWSTSKLGAQGKKLEVITDPPVREDFLDLIFSLLIVDYKRRHAIVKAFQHPYLEINGNIVPAPLLTLVLERGVFEDENKRY